MTPALLIKILIIGGIALCGVAVVSGIVKFFKRTARSAEAQVVRELMDMVSENGLDFNSEPDHPRLVSNMNRIYLPKIERDFPDFNWDEIRKMIEDEIRKEYEDKKDFEIEETVISRYEKSGQRISILCESSASYTESDQKKYICVQTTLSYVNFKTLDKSGNEQPRSLTCEKCGAPLTRLANGEVVCEYCSTVVIGEKIWKVTSIKTK